MRHFLLGLVVGGVYVGLYELLNFVAPGLSTLWLVVLIIMILVPVAREPVKRLAKYIVRRFS